MRLKIEKNNFSKTISETIELGNRLIFKQFIDSDFSNFKQKVTEISQFGIQILRNKVQLRTCQIVGAMQVDLFRLNLIQQIFFSDGKETYGKVNAKNTDVQIKKYILNINRYLPILRTNE